MIPATDLLAAALERHFDAATLRNFASESFGMVDLDTATADDLGSLARELARHCEAEGQLDSLLELFVRHRASVLFRGSEPPLEQPEARVDWLLERAEAESGAVRAATFREIAELYEHRLDSPDQAFVVWLQALADQPDAPGTVEAIARLATSRDQWTEAVDVLRDTLDAGAADARWIREKILASWCSDRLEQHAEAREVLERSIRREPPRAVSAALWTELGCLSEKEGRFAAARDEYQKALGVDPEAVIPCEGAGRLAFEAMDYGDAWRWLGSLLNRLDELPEGRRASTCLLAGDAARELGDWEAAQRSYLHAKAFLPADPKVLHRLAEVSWRAQQWDETAEFLKELLAQADLDLGDTERSTVFFRLGESLRQIGRLDEAIEPLEAARSLGGDDAKVLESLAQAYAGLGRWSDAASMSRQHLAIAPDASRFELLVAVGDFLSHEDSSRAAEAYEEALELREDDRNVLAKLMRVSTEGRRWTRLLEVLDRIAALEEDPKNRAKFHHTAGTILRRELQRYHEAADFFRKALDGDPTLDSAFDGLVDCLTREADTAGLVAAYRKYLDRSVGASPDGATRAARYDALANILAGPAGDPTGAIEAFEQAESLSGPHAPRLRKIADLHAQLPNGGPANAIAVHRRLLAEDPRSAASYAVLAELFAGVGRPLGARVAHQVRQVLESATQEMPEHYDDLTNDRQSPTRSHWDALVVGDRDPTSDFLERIGPAVVAAALATDLSSGNGGEGRPSTPDPLSRILSEAETLIGVGRPDVRVGMVESGRVRLDHSSTNGIVVGADLEDSSSTGRLRFQIGWLLSLFHPAHAIRRVIRDLADLRLWTLGSLRLVLPGALIPGAQSSEVDQRSQRLKPHLRESEMVQLGDAATRLLRSRQTADLGAWVERVDLTADRVGLALAGDLPSALAEIRRGDGLSRVSGGVRESALFRYSVSDAFLETLEGGGGRPLSVE